jgi:hypothetical protein
VKLLALSPNHCLHREQAMDVLRILKKLDFHSREEVATSTSER